MQRWVPALGGLFLSFSVLAGSADQVTVSDAYVRLAPPNAPATGAFMVLRNSGDQPARLVRADNPLSKTTELHTHINDNGVMRMRPVPAIDIPARGEAVLKPGSLHVMLIDMKQPLKEGDVVPLTLGFADGSSKSLQVPVRAMTPDSSGMKHHHGH